MGLMGIACLVIFAALAPPSWAANPEIDDAMRQQRAADERFALFGGCRPLGVSVRPIDAHARQMGVSQEVLHATAEGALRVAGLFDPAGHNQLGVMLRVVGSAFHLRVEYLKVLFNPALQTSGRAITWEAGTHGFHRDNPNHVLAALHRQLGRFVDAFRRVNAEACNDG